MAKPLNTVAMTAAFLAQAKADGMTEEEMAMMVNLLAADPELGDLIPGSGGCRKVRIARSGGGKSGGYRVVTFFAQRSMPVYVIAMLAKNKRATFTPVETAAMAKFAKAILAQLAPRAVG
jgi:hypothetical protein